LKAYSWDVFPEISGHHMFQKFLWNISTIGGKNQNLTHGRLPKISGSKICKALS